MPDKLRHSALDATGFEPAASASRTQRSTKLSHASIYSHSNRLASLLELCYHKPNHLSSNFSNFFYILNSGKTSPAGSPCASPNFPECPVKTICALQTQFRFLQGFTDSSAHTVIQDISSQSLSYSTKSIFTSFCSI